VLKKVKGLTVINTNMPILRPLAARRFIRFRASGEQISPKWAIFPTQDAPEPPCEIWRRKLYSRRRKP